IQSFSVYLRLLLQLHNGFLLLRLFILSHSRRANGSLHRRSSSQEKVQNIQFSICLFLTFLLSSLISYPFLFRCQSTRVPQIVQNQKKEVKRTVHEPFKISLHIGNFKPEDIKISLSGRILTVEGSQSTTTDSSSFSSSFKRMITLNDRIDLSTIYSKITVDGTLEIGANPRPIDRQIEITVEKAIDQPKEGDIPAPNDDQPILEAVGPDMECDQ
ncbi:hypothetical protein PRIPAC_92116, partial [Pristionchus pacificus]